jgi:basic membrane protein A
MKVKDEMGARVAFSESVPASDYEEVFRGYATQGFDVVMGHGFEFGDAAMKVAKDFPKTYFIVTSTNISQEPNVASFRINDPQSGFVQGVLAALLTKTGTVGIIGGMEIPPIINQQNGFKAGVRYAEEQFLDRDIEVRMAMTGSFTDVAKGKEMAKAMIEAGADVIAADADETNLGIFEAVKEGGVMALGSSGDQATVAPDVVVTSLVEDFGVAFVVLVEEIQNGNFEARAHEMGLEDNVVSMAPFRKFENKVSDQTKERIQMVIDKLINGEISVDKYLQY